MAAKKCVHENSCARRVNELMHAISNILMARSEEAEKAGQVENVAEVRAQATVMTALADRLRETILDADMENIDRMADSVLEQMKANEQRAQNAN
jgi:hypothetical protein